MKYFILIRAGLLRKKARTLLTMLSIIVAFLLFGLLQGINQDIKSGFGAAPTAGCGRPVERAGSTPCPSA